MQMHSHGRALTRVARSGMKVLTSKCALSQTTGKLLTKTRTRSKQSGPTGKETSGIPQTPDWLVPPAEQEISQQYRDIIIPEQTFKLSTESVQEFAYRCWWDRQCGVPVGSKRGSLGANAPANTDSNPSTPTPKSPALRSSASTSPRGRRSELRPRPPALSTDLAKDMDGCSRSGLGELRSPTTMSTISSVKGAKSPPTLMRREAKGKGRRGSMSDPILNKTRALNMPGVDFGGRGAGFGNSGSGSGMPLIASGFGTGVGEGSVEGGGEVELLVRDVEGEESGRDVEGRSKTNASQWRTEWSCDHKARGIEISDDGCVATLVRDGQVIRDKDIMRGGSWERIEVEYGSVRAKSAIPAKGVTYFEVTIEGGDCMSQGQGLGGGYFIGVCSDEMVAFDGRPEEGFRGKHALWALGDANSRPRGLVRVAGQNSVTWVLGSGYGHLDVIGVLIDMDERVLSFYKNGVKIGDAPSTNLADTVYPVVTLVNRGTRATIACHNFLPPVLYADYGGAPFFQMTQEMIKQPIKASKRCTRSAFEPAQPPLYAVRGVGPLHPEVMGSHIRCMSPQHVLLPGKVVRHASSGPDTDTDADASVQGVGWARQRGQKGGSSLSMTVSEMKTMRHSDLVDDGDIQHLTRN